MIPAEFQAIVLGLMTVLSLIFFIASAAEPDIKGSLFLAGLTYVLACATITLWSHR